MLAKHALRFTKLMLGLYLYGLGIALMVHASIGIPPWDVMAQGIAKQLHLSFGMATVLVSALVMLAWIPIRQKPGIGTLLNGLLIGVFADSVLPWLPVTNVYWIQLLLFVTGMVVVALAMGFYISTNYGTGPRDGFIVGMQRTLKRPLWIVRGSIELTVLALGWLLGGQVREGTVIFAVGIGYLMQLSFKAFGIKTHKPAAETNPAEHKPPEHKPVEHEFTEPEPDPGAF
jgi:uncharacterized membrane protein YczE